MNRHSDWDPDCKIYVGGLSDRTDKYELDEAFGKFGDVKNIWIARKPPGFAFIEMDDSKDAEDAVKDLDGTRIGGQRVRVERSNGGRGKGGGGGDRRGGRDGERDRYDDRRGGRDDRRGGRYGRDNDRSRSRSRGRGRRSPSYKSMERSPARNGRCSRDRSKSVDKFGREKRREDSKSPVRRGGRASSPMRKGGRGGDSKSPQSSPKRRSRSKSHSRSRSYSR